jgi:SH3 domain protein
MLKPRTKPVVAMLLALAFTPVAAMEFRSAAEHGVVLLASPATTARKLAVVSRGYPFEIITEQQGWLRVRDSTGQLTWVEKKRASDRRYVQVMVRTPVRKAADAKATVLFTADRDVLLEWQETGKTGWIKVRHAGGETGYVRIEAIWGV